MQKTHIPVHFTLNLDTSTSLYDDLDVNLEPKSPKPINPKNPSKPEQTPREPHAYEVYHIYIYGP